MRMLSLSFLLLALLCGCTTTPLRGPLPQELTLTTVATGLVADAPLAASGDGIQLALVRKSGLVLRPLAGGAERLLTAQPPRALAFSPDGTRIGALFAAGEGSELRLYDVATGQVLAQTAANGACDQLLAAGDEWLAVCTVVQRFRFGGNLRSRLLRWDGGAAPREELLNDVTLDPVTAQLPAALGSGIAHAVLSPWGDELLFLRLIDPPAFAPYRRVVLRHLASGAEQTVATSVALDAAAAYQAGGEAVIFGDGVRETRRFDPWSKTELGSEPLPGKVVAASPGGRSLWLDGVLRQDGKELLHFTDGTQPAGFLPGGRLLLRSPTRLFLVSGLADDAPAQLDGEPRRRLLQLRRWRAEGLIDQADYLQQRKELP